MRLNIGSGGSQFSNCINMDLVRSELVTDLDVQGNALALPFKDESFTEVLMIHVIEHIQYHHHSVVFGEIWRVLKKKGRLIMAFPDAIAAMKGFLENVHGKRWTFFQPMLYGRQAHFGDYHVGAIERQDITNKLFSAGFENIKYNLYEYNGMIVAYKGEKLNYL